MDINGKIPFNMKLKFLNPHTYIYINHPKKKKYIHMWFTGP